ncbi:MAG: SDR family NAD(P)-dependent oxidoreductase [Planctomycetales bacterium]|nr:SDR family NAD(P)-dependent oxidoreductase [Planctomycetales bacterium]
MRRPRILIQLDCDPQTSVFDSVVAADSGVEHLFRHRDVTPDQVERLVHGAMFTRGPQDLHSTAIFVGGSKVAVAEQLLDAVMKTFFGPLRVSVMLDPNGANTTAAAAVIAAGRHADLRAAEALVLGATGPVGQRAARLLAGEGAHVRLASRSKERAAQACGRIRERHPKARLTPVDLEEAVASLPTCGVLISAGAAGVEMLHEDSMERSSLQVAIDLNALPPVGLASVDVMDRGTERHSGIHCYGAIGVGGDKMKIHKAAIASLFESNSLVLDAEEIYEFGKKLLH